MTKRSCDKDGPEPPLLTKMGSPERWLAYTGYCFIHTQRAVPKFQRPSLLRAQPTLSAPSSAPLRAPSLRLSTVARVGTPKPRPQLTCRNAPQCYAHNRDARFPA